MNDHETEEPSTLTGTTPTQSRHRLPTISAADALLDYENGAASNVITGLETLDALLSNDASTGPGFQRGKITEIWGPPGGGKTALMLQVTRNVLLGGGHALWIDAMAPLNSDRLHRILNIGDHEDASKAEEALRRFQHVRINDITHLLALLMHPRADFPPTKTSLIILDDLHSLLDVSYPRFPVSTGLKGEQLKWQTGRRYTLLGTIVASLNKLALLQNLVVLLSTGCASRMRGDIGLGAVLVPGVGGSEWDAGVWNRLCVFRDFDCRFVGVQKRQGRNIGQQMELGDPGRAVAVDMMNTGMFREIDMAAETITAIVHGRTSPLTLRKRGFDEIADSEGECEGDDHLTWIEAENQVIAGEFNAPAEC